MAGVAEAESTPGAASEAAVGSEGTPAEPADPSRSNISGGSDGGGFGPIWIIVAAVGAFAVVGSGVFFLMVRRGSA